MLVSMMHQAVETSRTNSLWVLRFNCHSQMCRRGRPVSRSHLFTVAFRHAPPSAVHLVLCMSSHDRAAPDSSQHTASTKPATPCWSRASVRQPPPSAAERAEARVSRVRHLHLAHINLQRQRSRLQCVRQQQGARPASVHGLQKHSWTHVCGLGRGGMYFSWGLERMQLSLHSSRLSSLPDFLQCLPLPQISGSPLCTPRRYAVPPSLPASRTRAGFAPWRWARAWPMPAARSCRLSQLGVRSSCRPPAAGCSSVRK